MCDQSEEVTLTITKEQDEYLRRMAELHGRSLSQEVNAIVREQLQNPDFLEYLRKL